MTREEAVNWLINVTSDIGKAEYRNLWHYEQALCEIKEMLEQTTIEPKKGRWTRPFPTRPKTYERFCSECKGKAWYCGTGDYNFCPNCGADMREGEADAVD